MARISNYVEQIRGVSYKPEDVVDDLDETSIVLLRANNIRDGQINFDDVIYVKKNRVSDKQMLQKGDILICASSGSKDLVGKAAQVEYNINCTFGAFCKVVRPKGIHQGFLGMYFQSNKYRRTISQASAGANINNIKNENIDSLELDVPNDDKQEIIYGLLSKVNNVICARKAELAELDELIKARFVELFGATSANSCTRQIKDYADVLGGYAFKSEFFCSDAIPVIRISNINNGTVELDYTVCFSEAFWSENKRFQTEKGDILMAMSGATTGKAGLYNENAPALINQRVACLRAKDKIACPAFLYVATQLDWMYDLIQESSAGCAQPNISGKQIENMPVPNATYEEQLQFTSFVEQTDKSKFAVQKALDEAQLLFDSLMQKYFG